MNVEGVQKNSVEAYFWLEVVALAPSEGFKPSGKAESLTAAANR
jgi:hypothetical protein